MPCICARIADGALRLASLSMYRAIPSRLLQVSSTGALTVVAMSVVVPCLATVAVTVSSASLDASITSRARAMNVYIHKPRNHRVLPCVVLLRSLGNFNTIAPSNGGDFSVFNHHRGISNFFHRGDRPGREDHMRWHRVIILRDACRQTIQAQPVMKLL